ncbi:GTP 3',8-cyclase MoaA [Desulfonema magnum]|uniref:GTP 3',8-cyclase n=1 Tax=Desulfonema magnum TaxID=45655 RepID=A0A975BID6_9BACT|nr:GTP 3',8-cyclase MoaA [Desulfonema magnum]QTA85956.1 Molybdenum cofactor biosynthesis protein A [Desulfonema magnum]
MSLTDRYNRNLNYLRVSVTDRCNLRCIYCSPHNPLPLPHEDILTYEEILRIIRTGVRLGISKVRITGGEPLVRKGIYSFLKELGRIEGISDISLTTNGVFLKDNLEKIRSAGIKRLNISMDTLNRLRFKEITGRDNFDKVWEGIMSAHEMGFDPIKINVVVLNGINDDELTELAKLSFSYPFHIRFIEYMPIGNQKLEGINQDLELLAPDIMKRISVLGILNPVENGINDGPADRYQFEGAKGEIGLIRPLSHHFCYKCNRLRLTANGHLRACLLSDKEDDIKGPLRKGCSDSELADIFLEAVRHKPFEHHVRARHSSGVSGQMSAIGG